MDPDSQNVTNGRNPEDHGYPHSMHEETEVEKDYLP